MTQDIIFSSLDGIDPEKFILSTYSLEMESSADVLSVAREIAVGQTTGTWVPVPGETEQVKEIHSTKLLGYYPFPPDPQDRLAAKPAEDSQPSACDVGSTRRVHL